MKEIIQELKEIKEILAGIQALLLSAKEAPAKETVRAKQTNQEKPETVSEVFCGYTDDAALQNFCRAASCACWSLWSFARKSKRP